MTVDQDPPSGNDPQRQVEYGSDLIVDVLGSLGVEYVALNPGATIRGLHDSLVNYRGKHVPQLILCLHEEIAVAVAHGYAKVTGKPMAVGLHDIVGLLHGTMAVFNAWCDRVPILLIGGTGPMRQSRRRPLLDWIHTAQVQGNLVRDFVKWDVQPFGTEAIPPAMIRAYKTATTVPQGPVYVCFDTDDQEAPVEPGEVEVTAPLLPVDRPLPTAPDNVVQQVAAWIRGAARPVILVDIYNTGLVPSAVEALEDLADRWSIPVVDLGGRFNFPNQHPLCLSELREELVAEADLVLALDVRDLYGALRSKVDLGTRQARKLVASDVRIVSVTAETVPMGSLVEDYQAWQPVDIEIGMPAALFVPALTACLGSPADTAAVELRRKLVARRRAELEARWQEQLRKGWEDRPISTSRLAAELWKVLDGEDWLLANGHLSGWVMRLWRFDTDHPHLGSSGGHGLGYGLGASLGAALALKDTGKIVVNLQADGDFLYTPSALWTAAHYELPILIVVHNNRTYYKDELHQKEMAYLRRRPETNKVVGIRIDQPAVDFSALARSMGVWATGPVENPSELGDALRQAFERVKRDRKPAVVDVVCAAR